MFDSIRSDVRGACRVLVRRPAFSLAAVLMLSFGIGVTVAAFSVVDQVLLQPLPYPDAERLVSVRLTIPEWEGTDALGHLAQSARWSYEEFTEWADRQREFERASLVGTAAGNLTGSEQAEWVDIGLAGLDLFPMLGATPAVGRFFEARDERSNGRVAVISWRYWHDRLGGNPEALGTKLLLGGSPFDIVGVLPRDFAFPIESSIPVWIPVFDNRPGGFFPGNLGDMSHVFDVLGLLAPDTTASVAAENTGRLLRAINGVDHFTQHDAVVVPKHDEIVGPARPSLLVLLAAALMVLVVCCANVATLLLGQAVDRRPEIAIRSALGAQRPRVVRQLITESVLVGLLGGAGGLVVASYALRVLVYFAPTDLPRLVDAAIDHRAATAAVAAALLSGLMFGLAPALTLARAGVAGVLTSERFGSRGRVRLQAAVIVAEVAIATLLLMGAGLLTLSFHNVNAVDPGLRTDGVLSVTAYPDRSVFRDAEGEFDGAAMRLYFRELESTLEQLPGVSDVAQAQVVPFSGNFGRNTVIPEGHEVAAMNEALHADRRFVSPNFHELLEVPLIEGRYLESDDDIEGGAPVVVVNHALAKRFWPNESALGKRLTWRDRESVIVGVVGDMRDLDLTQEIPLQFYAPMAPFNGSGGSVLMRTHGDPAALVSAVRTAVREFDASLPIVALTPMDALISGTVASERYRAWLLAFLAAVATTLALAGLYGVTARAVASRQREFGIRIALGSSTGRILSGVIADALRLAVCGAAIGVAASIFAGRALSSFLVDVHPNDAFMLLAVVVAVVSTATLAALVPALRASRVEPGLALRR